jgi:hypothetical protein
MRLLPTLLLSAALAFAAALPASADIKGPNGEKCDTATPGLKHDIKGKHYTCDKCVFSKCDASGKTIDLEKCRQVVTHWTNCVEDVPASPSGKK